MVSLQRDCISPQATHIPYLVNNTFFEWIGNNVAFRKCCRIKILVNRFRFCNNESTLTLAVIDLDIDSAQGILSMRLLWIPKAFLKIKVNKNILVFMSYRPVAHFGIVKLHLDAKGHLHEHIINPIFDFFRVLEGTLRYDKYLIYCIRLHEIRFIG